MRGEYRAPYLLEHALQKGSRGFQRLSNKAECKILPPVLSGGRLSPEETQARAYGENDAKEAPVRQEICQSSGKTTGLLLPQIGQSAQEPRDRWTPGFCAAERALTAVIR